MNDTAGKLHVDVWFAGAYTLGAPRAKSAPIHRPGRGTHIVLNDHAAHLVDQHKIEALDVLGPS